MEFAPQTARRAREQTSNYHYLFISWIFFVFFLHLHRVDIYVKTINVHELLNFLSALTSISHHRTLFTSHSSAWLFFCVDLM